MATGSPLNASSDIDLAEFATKLVVRQMRITDFDAIASMQARCFEGMAPWQKDQIQSQLELFPEGQVVIEIDGKVAASSSSLILNHADDLEWHDWKKTADDGYIRNHQPDGDTLYGIEMMVDPEFRGMRLSRRLYDVRKEMCRTKNLAQMIVGGRLPGYHKHQKDMSAAQYVEKVLSKLLYDPVLTAQISNGFSLQGLIPDYMPSDVQSCGYATFLEWKNLETVRGKGRKLRRAVHPVRIGAVQYQMRSVANFDEFAKQARYFVDVAGDYKCDFLLFPELFTTQLLSCIPNQRPGTAARALAKFTPDYLELFADMAVSFDCNIIGGSQFVIENDDLYNISFLFKRDGGIEKQYKLHITPSEKRWWGVSGGNRCDVFKTDCGPISIQICYDCEFPELTRMAVDQGANLVFVPYNTDNRHGHLRVRTCAHARCIENHVYVTIAGCTGNLPFVENADIHYAQSAILTPADVMFARDGIAAEANPNVETVIIQDLDLEVLRRHRLSGNVQNWNDRRIDLYGVTYKRLGKDRRV